MVCNWIIVLGKNRCSGKLNRPEDLLELLRREFVSTGKQDFSEYDDLRPYRSLTD